MCLPFVLQCFSLRGGLGKIVFLCFSLVLNLGALDVAVCCGVSPTVSVMVIDNLCCGQQKQSL